MKPDRLDVTYNLSTIRFHRIGEGGQVLLAFHGFGESGLSFQCLLPSLGRKYTVYAMDLPYHGETEWREQHPFGKQDLEQIIRYWQKTTGTRTFSMLGFSMGGKCAMAALSMFPGQTENLFLLASDGIQTKRVFNVAVYPRWGRRLFKSTIKRPGWFFIFIRTMHQIGILSSWLLRFAMNHMDTMAKRQRLYDTWLSMADFTIDIDKFRQTIHTHQIPLHLIFGQRDEVIPPSVAKFLAKGLPSASVEIIDRGHYFIDEQLNAVLDKYMA